MTFLPKKCNCIRAADPEKPSVASYVLIVFSFLFVFCTLPLSLIFCVKVSLYSFNVCMLYTVTHDRNCQVKTLYRLFKNMRELLYSDLED